ncbi:MAG TPA: DUF3090 family protein [Methylomirabilota bacterium]|nr:DUF3090 family protein [Methylomirabilota bacterium]
MSDSFELDNPDHFTAGAVGEPGQRVFYMQGRQHGQVCTLKCEKEQVRALGEYLATLLASLATATSEAPPEATLLQPLEPAWAVRSIAAGYDADGDRIVVEARELIEDEAEDPVEGEAEPEEPGLEAEVSVAGEATAEAEAAEEAGARARFLITRAQAAAFVERARELMEAGRPECVLCALPMDPSGHVCPRSNGHLHR